MNITTIEILITWFWYILDVLNLLDGGSSYGHVGGCVIGYHNWC